MDVDYLLAAAAGGAAPAPKTGLKFATWSMIGAQTKFALKGDGEGKTIVDDEELYAGLESAGINIKSYLKFSGNALPNVPMYIELALAEQDTFENLYMQGETNFLDGLTNLAVDTIFDPMYYYGGQAKAKTYLGHLKFGVETPWVKWNSGYKYAKLPPHNINNWVTVDQEWEAGYESVGGYNYFELGSDIRQLGDFTINAAVAPNRSADRKGTQYGLFSWLDLDMNDFGKFGIQYNGAYGYTFDTIFGQAYEHDIIAGYNINLGNPKEWGTIAIKANGLYNFYGDGKLSRIDGVTYYNKYCPAASDVGEVDASLSGLANAAGNLTVTFNTGNDADLPIYVQLGARFRGVQASMMYVEEGSDDHTNISDQLGKRNHWRAWVDFNTKVNYESITIGLKPYIQMTLDPTATKLASNDASNIKVNVHPYCTFDFDEMMSFPATLSLVGDLTINTAEKDYFSWGKQKNMIGLPAASLKYTQKFDGDIIKKLDVVYAFDNTDSSNYMWNTVTAVAEMGFGWTFQAGAGLRTLYEGGKAKDACSPFGAFIGALTKLPILQKPTAYVQGMYGMDPYNKFGDGPTAFRMSADYDNLFKDGVSDYANSAAIRCGLQWDL